MADLYDPTMLKRTLGIVLAGGQGERLHPLTRDRAKPAVPFGGIYRIIDFTLSNCVNSGVRHVYVLTQYKSFSLDRHLEMGWGIFSRELGEFIVPLPPQQRIVDQWYRGTADAIYQNIYTWQYERPERILILGGDHVYKMNYSKMIGFHMEKGADLTVACIAVPLSDARRFGVMEIDPDHRIKNFVEKPPAPCPMPSDPDKALASMGIYVFNTEKLIRRVIEDAKRDTEHDFGKNIIPEMVGADRVYAWPFEDENKKPVQYWRDIGTIDAYWEANMDLVAVDPLFNLYDREWPIRAHVEQYPPAKTVFMEEHKGGRRGLLFDSLASPGCIISGGKVVRSILSPDVRVDDHAHVEECVLMDDVKVGKGARLRRTIVDKRVTIPDGMSIGFDHQQDAKRFLVTEGKITVVPKEMPL